ncbi:MAG: Crp/Fnr family transcriptional regulator [Dehalococcoidia bacterium]
MGPLTRIEKEALLARCPVFEGLDETLRQKLAALGMVRPYRSGDRIFGAGDPGDSMMVIAEGTVRIYALAPTARDVVLADLAAGEVFGDIAMLDGAARSADAQALTNCTLIVMERSGFLALMRRNPPLAEHMLALLCARIRRSDERMMEISFLSLPARLAKALLRAAGGAGGRPAGRSRTSLSQTELANVVGSSRENVNRHLRRWQDEGVIELRGGWIVLLDAEAISRIAPDAASIASD